MIEFNSFLKTLGLFFNLPDLKSDNKGTCLLQLQEGGVELLFEYDEHLVPYSILVSTFIGEVANDLQIHVYRDILKGNCALEATLSKKPDASEVYLHQRLSPEIDLKNLGILIEHFTHSAIQWRMRLHKESIPNV